jgi:hypothetical protein
MLTILFWMFAGPVLIIAVCVGWLWILSRAIRCLLGE